MLTESVTGPDGERYHLAMIDRRDEPGGDLWALCYGGTGDRGGWSMTRCADDADTASASMRMVIISGASPPPDTTAADAEDLDTDAVTVISW